MELLSAYIVIALLVAVFAKLLTKDSTKVRSNRDYTESQVEKELNRILSRKGYLLFGNLVIPSVSKRISSTQIDHVIVSIYGIFCIETKSHQGNIYGSYKLMYWKQYLGNRSYELYNPVRQNDHHVRSLEYLLRSRIKAPIHSYIIFPNAKNIKVDGRKLTLTPKNTIEQILRHSRQIYTLEDVEAIAKGLAYVSSKSDIFIDDHIEAVRRYIAS